MEDYFDQTARLISPGGYLFVRVNSVSTEISESHTRIEEDGLGGLTVEYQSGPKTGLPVHFYSRDELRRVTADGFELVGQLEESGTERTPPRTGRWAQWEGVWRRKGASEGSA